MVLVAQHLSDAEFVFRVRDRRRRQEVARLLTSASDGPAFPSLSDLPRYTKTYPEN